MARFLRTIFIPLFVLSVAADAWVLPRFEPKAALSALTDAIDGAARLVSRQENISLEPNELVDVLAVIASGTRDNESAIFIDAKAEIIAGGNATASLVARQDEDGGFDENSCRTKCSRSSCGSGSCAVNRAKARSLLDLVDIPDLPWVTDADGDGFGDASYGLHKRVFRELETVAAKRRHLAARERDEGRYEMLTEDTRRDVSLTMLHKFEDFQDRPLLITGPELTGCTVLTIVSRKAVYAGHFWQPSAFERIDNRRNQGPDLERNALNLIRGSGPLLVAEGDALDPTLFQDEVVEGVTIRPWAAFMTPAGEAEDGTPGEGGFIWYRPQINRIADLVQELIGIRPVIYGYIAETPYSQPATGRRGATLFEYEWDADGEGNGDWRCWYEYHHESGFGLGMLPIGRNRPS